MTTLSLSSRFSLKLLFRAFSTSTIRPQSSKLGKLKQPYNPIEGPPEINDGVKIDHYDLLDLQLKGYDFAVLEKYQSYLHRTMKKMDIHVTNGWSAPHQELQVETLRDLTTAVDNAYKLKIYERNLQMKDALVTKLSLLIDIIHMTSPPGVSFSIHRHSSSDDDRLYFRDSVLEKLKQDLQELKDTPLIGV